MAGASNLVKAIRLESPSVIPTSVSILPAMWIHHGYDTQHLVREFPQFFPEHYSVDYSDPNAVAHGTLIYMHTDGCIHEIMPDLVECGVDMINPQFRANGLDNLVRVCRKKQIIPINLDLDRQLFPFATRSQIFDHVAECVEALYLPQGGLSLNVELNYEIPIDNCAAILEALEKYRHYKG